MKPKFQEWVCSQGNTYLSEGLISLYENIQIQLDCEQDHLRTKLESDFDLERTVMKDAMERVNKYNRTLREQLTQVGSQPSPPAPDEAPKTRSTTERREVREELRRARLRIQELEGSLVDVQEDNDRLKRRNWDLVSEREELISKDKANHLLFRRVQADKDALQLRVAAQDSQIRLLSGFGGSGNQ